MSIVWISSCFLFPPLSPLSLCNTWEWPRWLKWSVLIPWTALAVEWPCNHHHGCLAAPSWGQGGSGATWEWPRGLLDGSNVPYLSPGQLWLVNDPITPTMVPWQPDLGVGEWPRGLLDGSNGPHLSSGQLWLVNDHPNPNRAAWQPDLGAGEGLEPLESDLEGC